MSTPRSSRPSSFRSTSSVASNHVHDSTTSLASEGARTEMSLELHEHELETPLDDGAGESESGKFRQILALLKRSIGVKDLAAMRLSLPASICEPIGNLESWMYAERPDFFAAMATGDTELERMLAVLRWTFTKDLRFVKHKIAKPYNSVLGEYFRCHFDIEAVALDAKGYPVPLLYLDENPTPEVLAAAGRSTAPLLPKGTVATEAKTRVVFLNEQTSHHPPISFFYLESRGPEGVVKAVGADQLSARFTGATVKVFPGPNNRGIFVTLPAREEEYQITHPTATVSGLLRGAPYAAIGECSYITCRGGPSETKLKCIINYLEESWLLKPKFLVQGIIYESTEGDGSEEYTKVKHVPTDKVVATFDGCWRGEIRWKATGSPTGKILLDMVPLGVIPKTVAPLSEQSPSETRKVWEAVTNALHAKEWTNASKFKQAIEQEQRNKAEERKKTGEKYVPTHFVGQDEEWDGRPVLNALGVSVVEKQFEGAP